MKVLLGLSEQQLAADVHHEPSSKELSAKQHLILHVTAIEEGELCPHPVGAQLYPGTDEVAAAALTIAALDRDTLECLEDLGPALATHLKSDQQLLRSVYGP